MREAQEAGRGRRATARGDGEAREGDGGDDGVPRRGRRATMRGGMRASGRDISSPPPPTTLQPLVPTHSHSWLVVDAIKLSFVCMPWRCPCSADLWPSTNVDSQTG